MLFRSIKTTMNKTLLAGLAVAAIAAMPQTFAIDQIQVGYSGSSYGAYQTGQGGEFTFNPLTGWIDLSGYATTTKNVGVNGTFQSFCIEHPETINGYSATYNAAITTGAINGGNSGPNPDPVSVGTGWLYSQFARGTLANYDYAGNRLASADQLQKAIWMLEEGDTWVDSNVYIAAVVTEFGTKENAKADGGYKYGVYALNLTTAGGYAQDGLVMVADGGTTLLLLGMGFGGLAFVSRRNRK